MARIFAFIGTLAIALSLITAPKPASAGVFIGAGIGIGIGVSINIAPPALPVYVQPPVVVADQIWTPGYWAYGPNGYYWVPGTWVTPPQPGYLWTPGYWAFNAGSYGWHAGYWGPHVGFYGGVNYGFGYTGIGYAGGAWIGGHFSYNRAVTNVNTTVINNVYVDRTVINNTYNNNRVSFNGGPDGIRARPTAEEGAYRNEQHFAPTPEQQQHVVMASQNRNYLATVNQGRPENPALAAPLSRENRPANDAFARFNQNRGVSPSSNAYRAPSNSYRAAAPSYHAPASTYRAPARTYRAPVARPAFHPAPAHVRPPGGNHRDGR